MRLLQRARPRSGAEADYKTIIDLAPEDHGYLQLAMASVSFIFDQLIINVLIIINYN